MSGDSSRRIRLVPGSLASARLLETGARIVLLAEAVKLYPAMRGEIEQLSRIYREEKDPQFLEKSAAIFCMKYGLVDGRDPAPWAIEAVSYTIQTTADIKRWAGWRIHYAEYVPTDGEDLGIDPSAHVWRAQRPRLGRRAREAHPSVRRAWERAGWSAETRGWDERTIRLAIRHQIGGLTWERLADEEGVAEAATLRTQARAFLQLVGLRRPPGRPRGAKA